MNEEQSRIAETIRQQAHKAFAMIGARCFLKGTDKDGHVFLQCDIPKNQKGVKRLRIAYAHGADTYTVNAYKQKKRNGLPDYELASQAHDVYADTLDAAIAEVTGLATRL